LIKLNIKTLKKQFLSKGRNWIFKTNCEKHFKWFCC